MNLKRFLAATLAIFVFIFLYEWIFHGVLLMNVYQQTPNVWRPLNEMMEKMPLACGVQIMLSLWIAFVFTQIYPQGGLKHGLQYGIFFGVFAGILSGSWYIYLPVAANLGFAWFAGSVIEGVACGLLAGLIYRSEKESVS